MEVAGCVERARWIRRDRDDSEGGTGDEDDAEAAAQEARAEQLNDEIESLKGAIQDNSKSKEDMVTRLRVSGGGHEAFP